VRQVLPSTTRITILSKRLKNLELGAGDYDAASRPLAIKECSDALDRACEAFRRERLYAVKQ